MANSRGDMFPDVITRNIIKGKCPGECGYCYMRHGKLTKIEAYHKPFHIVEKELAYKFKPDMVYFIGSATDIWSPAVPVEQQTTLIQKLNESDVPESAWFLFSTKFVKGYLRHFYSFPANTILSVTFESDKNADYERVSLAPHPETRLLHLKLLKRRIVDNNYPYKLMVNMEPALSFNVDSMLEAIEEIRPDFMVFGADTSGWCNKNGILQANWRDILLLLERVRPSVGQILIKKNIWRIAPPKERGMFHKLMREHAKAFDFAIQKDPQCSKRKFFLGEENEQATTGDLFGS